MFSAINHGKEKSFLPTSLTLDEIKRLRREGQNSEANRMLNTFRNNCEKNKKQEFRELTNYNNKILRVKNKQLKIKSLKVKFNEELLTINEISIFFPKYGKKYLQHFLRKNNCHCSRLGKMYYSKIEALKILRGVLK